MGLEALMRNNPFFQQMMLKDTKVVHQEIVHSNELTNEKAVIINHRRFIPGSLQEKRRPLN